MDNQNTVIPNGGGARAGQYITDGTCKFILIDTRDGTPVGRVVADICVRDGYVKANGATVLRDDYPRLVQFVDKYNLWTTEATKATYPGKFGKGNGSTTMSLPDYRGVVGRYLDEGRGLDDVNRALATYQGDAMQNLTGYINTSNGWTFTLAGGAFYPTSTERQNKVPLTADSAVSTFAHFGLDASRVARTAAENRAKNIAVMAVIRY